MFEELAVYTIWCIYNMAMAGLHAKVTIEYSRLVLHEA